MLRMLQELFEVAGTLDGTRNFSLKTSFCSVVWQPMSGILHLTGFRRSFEVGFCRGQPLHLVIF